MDPPPPTNWGDIATTVDLRQSIANLGIEPRGDVAELRGEMAEFRGELALTRARSTIASPPPRVAAKRM